MFSIGEFSKITGLSIKALRLYHEQGILVPRVIDEQSGYRYYDFDNVERARAILILRELMFPLEDIKRILSKSDADSDVIGILETHRVQIEAKIREMKSVTQSLSRVIEEEKNARQAAVSASYRVEEKRLEPIRIAGIRIQGRYADSGQLFAKLGRSMGRFICGKAMNLYYDGEYKEEGADFESCFPVRTEKAPQGISVRELEGGSAVTLIHQGPYPQLGRSYAKVFNYIEEKGFKPLIPSREIYIKGPGLLFKGDPKRYLTEIQVLVDAG